MILNKLIKIGLLAIIVSFFSNCYDEPFFELRVAIVNQQLEPVSNVNIDVLITDIDSGNINNDATIDLNATSDGGGLANFSFQNKAFVTVRACKNNLCREGHIYLEENITKDLTLMLEEHECDYCL